MNPRVVLFPLAVLLVGGGIALYSRGTGKPVAPPPQVIPVKGPPDATGIPAGPWKPQNIRTQLAPRTEKIPCIVRAPDPVVLHPTVASTPVEKVLAQEGQAVRKGDVLVVFASAQWERALAAAEKSGNAARAGEARKALASLEVRAPVDGIVYAMNARRGERPIEFQGTPGPLVVLFDWHQLHWEATAPASLAEILARRPQLFVQAGKGTPVEAEIVKSGPAAADGSIPLVLRPTKSPNSVPEPGGPGEVRVMVGNYEATVVPADALRTIGGRPTVFMVTIVGELVPRTVTPGVKLEGGFVEISGVKMGESVAVWE